MAQVSWSVQSGGQTTAPLYTDVAYAGVKYGLAYDTVISLPYQQTDVITPGIVLCTLANGTGALPSVAAAQNATLTPAGVFLRDALNDHAPDPYFFPSYAAPTAAVLSMMTQGQVWCQAGGTCTARGPVHYDANGLVSDGGANLLPRAIFLTVTQSTAGGSIVVVELDSPFSS